MHILVQDRKFKFEIAASLKQDYTFRVFRSESFKMFKEFLKNKRIC